LFALEFLVDWNASRALRRAGYRITRACDIWTYAYRLRHDPRINALIEAELAKRGRRAGKRAEMVMEDLERRGDLAEQAKQFGPAIRASELQGKALGMFFERQIVEGGESPIPFVVTRVAHPKGEPEGGGA